MERCQCNVIILILASYRMTMCRYVQFSSEIPFLYIYNYALRIPSGKVAKNAYDIEKKNPQQLGKKLECIKHNKKAAFSIFI